MHVQCFDQFTKELFSSLLARQELDNIIARKWLQGSRGVRSARCRPTYSATQQFAKRPLPKNGQSHLDLSHPRFGPIRPAVVCLWPE